MPWSSRYAVRTFFGTHMHQASMSSSRSSSSSSTMPITAPMVQPTEVNP